MNLSGKTYILSLADGENWQFASDDGAADWLERFASTMMLEPGASADSPRIIFTRNGHKKGWRKRDLGSIGFWTHHKSRDVFCSLGDEETRELDIVRMWLSLNPVYERAINSGGVPMHSALVERGSLGVLLAAAGDTGKSTCCKRIPPPWRGVCDDETLVVRAGKGIYRAHPFPTWSNYIFERKEAPWPAGEDVPVNAVFFLRQSPEDRVEPVGEGRAAMLINDSASQVMRRVLRRLERCEETDLRRKVFENVCRLAASVPAFVLHVSVHGRFWEKIDGALR